MHLRIHHREQILFICWIELAYIYDEDIAVYIDIPLHTLMYTFREIDYMYGCCATPTPKG